MHIRKASSGPHIPKTPSTEHISPWQLHPPPHPFHHIDFNIVPLTFKAPYKLVLLCLSHAAELLFSSSATSKPSPASEPSVFVARFIKCAMTAMIPL